jgi:hypothetical protein
MDSTAAAGYTSLVGLGSGPGPITILSMEFTAIAVGTTLLMPDGDVPFGGGGIFNEGTPTINNSTITNNTSDQGGGGIFGGSFSISGGPTISTFGAPMGFPILFEMGGIIPIETEVVGGVLTVMPVTPPAVPESGSTLAMLGLVTAGLMGVRRRRA